MILVLDAGNTNIVLGVFQDGSMVTNWRISTDRNKSSDEYGMIINQLFEYNWLKMRELGAVVMSSLVPPIMRIRCRGPSSNIAASVPWLWVPG